MEILIGLVGTLALVALLVMVTGAVLTLGLLVLLMEPGRGPAGDGRGFVHGGADAPRSC